MKLGQIRKFFFDNNIIIQKDMDFARCNYLTFLAAVFLGLDGKAVVQNGVILMEDEMEDYSFSSKNTLFFHRINACFGYRPTIMNDHGFKRILREQNSFSCAYRDLADCFSYSKKEVWNCKMDYSDMEQYYTGSHVFFIAMDANLTKDEYSRLDKIRDNKQFTFCVYRDKGELDIF